MEFETDVLADLIARKHRCLVDLRDLGRRQIELIERDEITRLLDLLSAKQNALTQLQRIERKLAPFRGQDPEGRQWRTLEARRQCARRLSECEALLAEIVDQEKRSERELVQRRDEAALRLHGVHTARDAHGAYVGTSDLQGRQLDLLSDA